MTQRITLLCFALFFSITSFSQTGQTANQVVPPFTGNFRFGTNMGAYTGWTDDDLANLVAGNASLGLPGAGVRALRPTLPEYFLEFWGYNIRQTTFQHYASLDLKDNTVFIGFPSADHRDPAQYCPGSQSMLFANMYEPIWDNGANGTPVNDNNYYALYVYKMVNIYKGQVKFWEIWNEPDYDYSANGWKPKGMEGNWYDNIPEPCDYTLQAPVFHYIRLLRISYEVIKSIDPTAYVTVGGLGYPSFLDLILRHTDNPQNGAVSADFPLRGGAYFDVVSYHSYPHFDGSLRYWSNDINGFVHTRHSDAAMKGVVGKKAEFQQVLDQYGYDGSPYPEKLWIITESNIPRKAFQDYIGSEEAQRNFLIKTLVACQQEGIAQYHLYTLADKTSYNAANNEFDVMGLFKKLEGTSPNTNNPNDVATAGRTFQKLVYGKKYDADETARLNLSANVRGAAFKANNGNFVYVLWAVTKTDRSEAASRKYTFPQSMGIDWVEKKPWNFAKNGQRETIAAADIQLTGDPVFLTKTTGPTATASVATKAVVMSVYPNPSSGAANIQFSLTEPQEVLLEVVDATGKVVKTLAKKQYFSEGEHQVLLSQAALVPGIYFIRLALKENTLIERWVKL